MNLQGTGGTLLGVAGLTELDDPADNRVHQTAVQVTLYGTFASGEQFDLHLRHGTCDAPGDLAYPLQGIVAQSGQPAQSGTVVDAPLSTLLGVRTSLEAIELATPGHPGGPFACGNLP